MAGVEISERLVKPLLQRMSERSIRKLAGVPLPEQRRRITQGFSASAMVVSSFGKSMELFRTPVWIP
jgi:hypothetical protein